MKKHLGSRFASFREQIGTAGLIIGVIALVAAMGGGAYAASGGLNSKQKKEVKKIAKQFAGKPGKAGKNGTNGTNGANGKDGATGPAGAAGKDGAPGTPGPAGPAPTLAPEAPGAACPAGGTKITSGASTRAVCNGEEGVPGQPWVPEGTLPDGATETGTVGGAALGSAGSPATGMAVISIPIPLADPPEPILLKPNEPSNADCPGIVDDIPQADPGKLCVYLVNEFAAEPAGFVNPVDEFLGPGATTTGTTLLLTSESNGYITGVWAVTA